MRHISIEQKSYAAIAPAVPPQPLIVPRSSASPTFIIAASQASTSMHQMENPAKK